MTDAEFASELRKWWSFDDHERHTHSWHDREDFIEKRLPALLASVRENVLRPVAVAINPHANAAAPGFAIEFSSTTSNKY